MSKVKPAAPAITRLVRDTCLCLHLQRAARVVGRRYDQALRSVELSNEQFSLLTSLNRSPPPGIGETSALLGMDRTTITASLKALERRGLVEVIVDLEDKRARRLVLTPRGRQLLASAIPLWKQAQAECKRLLQSGADSIRAELRAIS